MTDALTNAERLLREKCERARLMGQRCNPQPPFLLCECCAAADALAAERERRGEPGNDSFERWAWIVEYDDRGPMLVVDSREASQRGAGGADARFVPENAFKVHVSAALPLPPATGERERRGRLGLTLRQWVEQHDGISPSDRDRLIAELDGYGLASLVTAARPTPEPSAGQDDGELRWAWPMADGTGIWKVTQWGPGCFADMVPKESHMHRDAKPFLVYVKRADGHSSARPTPEPSEAMVEAAMNVPDHKALYHDLLYAVVSKWPNETRHQTALRYIQEHEASLRAALAAQEAVK